MEQIELLDFERFRSADARARAIESARIKVAAAELRSYFVSLNFDENKSRPRKEVHIRASGSA